MRDARIIIKTVATIADLIVAFLIFRGMQLQLTKNNSKQDDLFFKVYLVFAGLNILGVWL